MRLPYDMGNAGDLLKHGVLAEFVRWRCESGRPGRFIDLFGGEPQENACRCEVVRRVRALPDGALRAAQKDIDSHVYYGSGFVARHSAENADGSIRVVTNDRDPERRDRLQKAGFSMLDEEFPRCGVRSGGYDAWDAFAEIALVLDDDDLVLLDPYGEFLRERAPSVVPQMAEAAARGAVLLFALNEVPDDEDGQRFDELLERHVPGAWRMTCPRLPWIGVRGESKYHVDVVLAARPLPEGGTPEIHRLRKTLTEFAGDLAGVLGLPAGTLDPRDVPSRPLGTRRA